jgi:SAM-dependent methyltransferase
MNIDYTRHYKKWHDGSYETSVRISKSYYQYIQHLDLPKNSKILDLGCGMGSFLIAVKDKGYEDFEGIDMSTHQIAVAKQHGINVSHVTDGHSWLANRSEMFDAIFLYDVLEHIPVAEQIAFLADIQSALKPGGTLFLRTPNANSTFGPRYRSIDWTHHCAFTEHSLDFVLYNGGFTEIEIREDYFGKYPLWVPRPSPFGLLRGIYFGIRRLQAIAEFGPRQGKEIPLTINIIGIARKIA